MNQKIWREKFKRGRLKIKPNEAVDRKKVSAQHRTRHSREVLVSPIFYLTDSSLAAEIIFGRKTTFGERSVLVKASAEKFRFRNSSFSKFQNDDVFNFFWINVSWFFIILANDPRLSRLPEKKEGKRTFSFWVFFVAVRTARFSTGTYLWRLRRLPKPVGLKWGATLKNEIATGT